MRNAKRPHFLQGFDPSSSCERLKIPSQFIKHLEGKTFGTVTLVGPSEKAWYVNLIQLEDDLFFSDGWDVFVRDHFLQDGDSLVFRYNGNLHFLVQVFDESSCEKESTFVASCSQDWSKSSEHNGNKRERGLLDNIGDSVPKKSRSSQAHSECLNKNHGWPLAALSGEMDNFGRPLDNSVTVALPSAEAIASEKFSKEDEPNPFANAGTSLLSVAEAERLAQTFSSSFPSFTKVMKRFNISGSYTLNIPYQFSTAHLPNCKVKIVLRNLKGESWTVNSIPSTKLQPSHTFCGGWPAFVRDNNINIGDICIFELLRICELRVRILRVEKEGIDCLSSKGSYKGLNNGSAATSKKNSGRLPKKKRVTQKLHLSVKKVADYEDLLRTKINHEPAFGNDVLEPDGASKHNRNGKAVIQKKSISQAKQGFHTKGCISIKSDPEEKMAAQSFVSSFPHFVRSMKKFNVSGSFTLKIPYQFSMEHLPSCKTVVVLSNLKAKSWTVNSIPTRKVQTLHTFCGGWMAFVRDNNIQMGDICIFELVGKNEMRVHIYGAGKGELDHQNGTTADPNELTVASLLGNHQLL